MRQVAHEQGNQQGRIGAALGAMSGTSLDGVDAAVLRTDGHDILRLRARRAIAPYRCGTRA